MNEVVGYKLYESSIKLAEEEEDFTECIVLYTPDAKHIVNLYVDEIQIFEVESGKRKFNKPLKLCFGSETNGGKRDAQRAWWINSAEFVDKTSNDLFVVLIHETDKKVKIATIRIPDESEKTEYASVKTILELSHEEESLIPTACVIDANTFLLSEPLSQTQWEKDDNGNYLRGRLSFRNFKDPQNEVGEFEMSEIFVAKLVLNGDKSRLLAVFDDDKNEDNILRIWDFGKKKFCLRHWGDLRGHTWSPTDAAFSFDGRSVVASSKYYNHVYIWDLEEYFLDNEDDNACRKILLEVVDYPRCVIFTPDNNTIVASGNGNRIEAWPARQKRPPSDAKFVSSLIGSNPTHKHQKDSLKKKTTCLVLCAEYENLLLTADCVGIVRAWFLDLPQGNNMREYPHTQAVTGLSFLPFNDTHVLSGSRDCSIRLWDLVTGQNVKTFPRMPKGSNYISFSEDNPNLVATCNDAGDVRVMNVYEDEYLAEWDVFDKPIRKVLFVPGTNGSQVAFPAKIKDNDQFELCLLKWNVYTSGLSSNDSESRHFNLKDELTSDSVVIQLMEPSTKNASKSGEKAGKNPNYEIMDFTFSQKPVPGYYAAACRKDRVTIWRTSTKTVVAQFRYSNSSLKFVKVEFDPFNEDLLATGDSEGNMCIWNWKSGAIEQRYPGPDDADGPITAMAFSRTNPNMILSARESVVYVWSRSDMNMEYSNPGINGVCAIAFPNKRDDIFAVSTKDQCIYIFAAESGHMLLKTGAQIRKLPKPFESSFSNLLNYDYQLEKDTDHFDSIVSSTWKSYFRISIVGNKYFKLSLPCCSEFAFIPRHTRGFIIRKIFRRWEAKAVPLEDAKKLITMIIEDCRKTNPQNIYSLFAGLVGRKKVNMDLINHFFSVLKQERSYNQSTVFLGLFPLSRQQFPLLFFNAVRFKTIANDYDRLPKQADVKFPPTLDRKVVDNKILTNKAIIGQPDLVPVTSDIKLKSNKPREDGEYGVWSKYVIKDHNVLTAYVNYLHKSDETRWTIRNDVTLLAYLFKRLPRIVVENPGIGLSLFELIDCLESRSWSITEAHRFMTKPNELFFDINSLCDQIDFGLEQENRQQEAVIDEDDFVNVVGKVLHSDFVGGSLKKKLAFGMQQKKVDILDTSVDCESQTIRTGSKSDDSKSLVTTGSTQKNDDDDDDDDGEEASDGAVTAVPCFVPIENLHGDNFTQLIANIDDLKFYRLPSLQRVIDYKWKTFGRRRYLIFIIFYVLWILLFLFNHFGFIPNMFVTYTLDNWDINNASALLFTVVFAVLTLIFSYLELRQLKVMEASSYFQSIINFQDLATYILALGITCVRIATRYGKSGVEGSDVAVVEREWPITVVLLVSISFMFLKLLHHLQPFPNYGTFIRISLEITKQIFWLLLLMIIILFAFVQLFLAVSSPSKLQTLPDALYVEGQLLVQSYFMLISQANYEDLDSIISGAGIFTKVIYMVFAGIVIILMLNLLISIMGFISENTQDHLDQQVYRSKAKALVEVETTLVRNTNDKIFFPRFIGYYEVFDKYVEFMTKRREEKRKEELLAHDEEEPERKRDKDFSGKDEKSLNSSGNGAFSRMKQNVNAAMDNVSEEKLREMISGLREGIAEQMSEFKKEHEGQLERIFKDVSSTARRKFFNNSE